MRHKDIHTHPQFSALAKKTDDLQYILLTYGGSFSPEALAAVQADYQNSDAKCQKLCLELEAQGWRAYSR